MGSVRETVVHVIENIEIWTDLMRERPVRLSSQSDTDNSAKGLLERLDFAYTDFADLAKTVSDEGRLNGTWVDVLDKPPTRKTYAGAILHVITHDMHHRAELLHMLSRLGLEGLPEGDLLSWEEQELARGLVSV